MWVRVARRIRLSSHIALWAWRCKNLCIFVTSLVCDSPEAALRDYIAQLEATKAGLLSDLQAGEESQRTLDDGRSKLIENHRLTMEKLSDRETELCTLKEEQQAFKRQIKDRDRELANCKEQLERLKEKDAVALKQLQEMRTKLKEIEALREDQNLELMRVKTEHESSLQVVEHRNINIQELRQQIEQMENQLKEVRQLTSKSGAEAEKTQILFKKKETEWGAKLRSLQTDLDSLTGRLRASGSEIQSLKTQLVDTKNELQTTKGELDQLTTGEIKDQHRVMSMRLNYSPTILLDLFNFRASTVNTENWRS